MVPYSPSKWYHFLSQYGTIFYRNMVPYSSPTLIVLKIKSTITFLQNNSFSSSKWVSLSFFAKKEARKRLYVGSYAAMVSSARPITPTACQAGDFLRMTRNMFSAPRREGLRPVDAGSRFSENTQCHRNNGSRYPINKTRARRSLKR